jgi:hypothetical protein
MAGSRLRRTYDYEERLLHVVLDETFENGLKQGQCCPLVRSTVGESYERRQSARGGGSTGHGNRLLLSNGSGGHLGIHLDSSVTFGSSSVGSGDGHGWIFKLASDAARRPGKIKRGETKRAKRKGRWKANARNPGRSTGCVTGTGADASTVEDK